MSDRPSLFAATAAMMAGLVALLALPGPAPAQDGAAAAMMAAAPMAVAWKLDTTGATTRLSFDLSAAVDAHAVLLEGPDRVIVDLPQVNFQIDPAVGHLKAPAGGLVKSFRFGLFAPGRSRIVIDLAGPAALTRLGSAPIAGGDPARLTIELARTDRPAFHKAALAAAEAEQPTTAAPPPVAAPTPSSTAAARPVIVIDPGHGGVDPGASGLGGAVEKTITFDFAAMLADKLNASGRYTAIMTRRDDSFVSLGERVRIARDANAALFVSIHADTVAASPGSVTGATVYTCSDRASDAEAARVAATENEADEVAGVEAAPQASDVNDVLFDLTRRETRTYAHLFQRTLLGYLQKTTRLNKNPERAAGFKVLQAPDVPSVLLELGYLSSDKDIKALTSPEWRAGATASVVGSIDAFFAQRQADDAPTVAAAPAQPQAVRAN